MKKKKCCEEPALRREPVKKQKCCEEPVKKKSCKEPALRTEPAKKESCEEPLLSCSMCDYTTHSKVAQIKKFYMPRFPKLKNEK